MMNNASPSVSSPSSHESALRLLPLVAIVFSGFLAVGLPLPALPLYVNGGGVVPIGEALWSKGLPLGTVMALMMSAIALSIPEAVMLRRVLKPQLLALFFGSVAVAIMVVGYLFNFIYA